MNAACVSAEEFVELLSQHQVIDSELLWQFLAGKGGGSALPDDAAELADDLVRRGLLHAHQADALLSGKGETLHVAKYLVLHPVPRPGGEAYLAQRKPGGQLVVLKVCDAADADGVARLRREAETVARIDHPSIVTVKDTGEDRGRFYVALDRPAGMTFADIVAARTAEASGPLPVEAAVVLFRGAALALAGLHENGVVHGGLTPDLFVADDDLRVTLADLGPYAREGGDPRDDVYSLGMVLVHLLSGREVHSGVPGADQISAARQDVPEGLLRVVAKMTERDPSARYATLAEVSADMGSDPLVRAVTSGELDPYQEPKPQTAVAGLMRVLAVAAVAAAAVVAVAMFGPWR